jgi:hypothetical protein
MFANLETKREYYRLSMAIAKAKKEARDYQDLLVARNKLKKTSLNLNFKSLKTLNSDLKNSLNNSLNLNDLNQNLNNLNETLKRVLLVLEKASLPTSQSRTVVPKKTALKATNPQTTTANTLTSKRVTLKIDTRFIEPSS